MWSRRPKVKEENAGFLNSNGREELRTECRTYSNGDQAEKFTVTRHHRQAIFRREIGFFTKFR